MSGISVGVDVGGTFTDLVAVHADGSVEVRKVLSTPGDQSLGVENALHAFDGASVGRLVHGTTVATNTLLERSGANVVLCMTAGFTDILELRRQNRISLYDLAAHHPLALVPPERTIGVNERIAPEGVITALDDVEAERVAHAAAALSPDIVAICLLHAYADPVHELRLRDAFARVAPRVEVVLSSEVFPEIREYERTATTTAEAYLRPGVASYLRSLAARLAALGFPAPGVMTSSGGMRGAEDAARSASQLALSGPAGGVVGAATVARAVPGVLGHGGRALTIDIGGTSADVGLILDGSPLVEPGGSVAGIPIALPRVLVETVSAGGGSIGWVDEGGALRVGPRSAGAVPGPAAFRRGGKLPTVTDAHVVLGHITAARLGAEVEIDAAAARQAVETLASQLGETVERVAEAMISTADAAMARALRRVSVERGVDPRECTLIAFGGGGPLHACGLADTLGMRRIFVPPHAGVLSALGLAVTAERREAMTSIMRPTHTVTDGDLDQLLRSMQDRVPAADGWTRATWVRVRYAGQGHELDVPLAPTDSLSALTSRFAELHQARFGFNLDTPVELVSARHAASGEPLRVSLQQPAYAASSVTGPASVALPDATLLVAAGWVATTLPEGGWMLRRGETQ